MISLPPQRTAPLQWAGHRPLGSHACQCGQDLLESLSFSDHLCAVAVEKDWAPVIPAGRP